MRHTKLVSLLIALVMVFTCLTALSIPAAAVEPGIAFNVSASQCQGNRSAYPFPAKATTITQGNCYYINLAATTDFYLDRYELYIKAPGQSDYSLLYVYDPSGYFRWESLSYTFTQAGTYSLMPIITDTNGAQYGGELSITVAASTTYSASGNTYTYNGNTYNVVPNLKSDYCFDQYDYDRFVTSNGNSGCTATSMCIAYSIYHNSALSPKDVKWCSKGTSWEYCTEYQKDNRTYNGWKFTQKEALQCVYDCTGSGKPIILGVTGLKRDHVVTAVGVRSGADYYNLSLSDILIVDPLDGEIRTLAKYTGVDLEWALRVPID